MFTAGLCLIACAGAAEQSSPFLTLAAALLAEL